MRGYTIRKFMEGTQSFQRNESIWCENNRILSVMMDGDNEEQILKVAKSVKQIK